MKFEDMTLLKDAMDEAQKQIVGNGDFASAETSNYHESASNFLKAGQIYYNDKDLNMPKLMELYNSEAATIAKENIQEKRK